MIGGAPKLCRGSLSGLHTHLLDVAESLAVSIRTTKHAAEWIKPRNRQSVTDALRGYRKKPNSANACKFATAEWRCGQRTSHRKNMHRRCRARSRIPMQQRDPSVFSPPSLEGKKIRWLNTGAQSLHTKPDDSCIIQEAACRHTPVQAYGTALGLLY